MLVLNQIHDLHIRRGLKVKFKIFKQKNKRNVISVRSSATVLITVNSQDNNFRNITSIEDFVTSSILVSFLFHKRDSDFVDICATFNPFLFTITSFVLFF